MKSPRWSICLIALIVTNAASAWTRAHQVPAASPAIYAPAVEHYRLSFEVDLKHNSLSGQAEIGLKNSSTDSITVIPVLLYRLMEVEAASDANGKSLSFTQRVVRFADEPKWQANAIQITLATALGPGQTTTLRLKYAGALFGYREVMAYVKDTISEDYSLLRTESMPYPLIAAPSYAGWRTAYRNNFDYQVEAAVPQGYIAVCSGDQIGEPQRQADKTIFRCAGPAESNSINVAIAKFRVIDDAQRKLRVYALETDTDAGNRIMNEMRRSLDFFTSYFGPPPKIGTMGAHNGLTVIEIPDGWGSYGLRGYIFQTAAAFKDAQRAGELYHEVGHVWNARIADRVQRSRYFDEAFAAYFEALAVRQFEGEQAYRALLDSYRDIFIERVNREPLGKTTPIVDYGKYEIGVFSYSKGAWSLYVLHQLLGEETFRRALADFLTSYGEKPADFENFRRSLEKSSGRDLNCWFQQWITSGAESSALLIGRKNVSEMVAQCQSQ